MDDGIELPHYSHNGDAALEIRSNEDLVLTPGERKAVKTGLQMAIPPSHVGLVWDKSGMASNHGIHCIAGVVDSTYRGELQIAMINLSKNDFKIEKGMRIAQMIIQPYVHVDIEQADILDDTARGEKAFGSTGLY